jgi:hypothetical protein
MGNYYFAFSCFVFFISCSISFSVLPFLGLSSALLLLIFIFSCPPFHSFTQIECVDDNQAIKQSTVTDKHGQPVFVPHGLFATTSTMSIKVVPPFPVLLFLSQQNGSNKCGAVDVVVEHLESGETVMARAGHTFLHWSLAGRVGGVCSTASPLDGI